MNFDPQTGQPIGGGQPQPMPQTPVQPVPPVAPQAPVPPVPAAAPGYGMPQQPQQPIPQAPTPPVAPVPPQKSGSPVIFIVIGVAALLIVAGIIGAVVVLGGKKGEKGGEGGKDTKITDKSGGDVDKDIDDILDDYEKEKKINEEIKDQYETKVYELGEEILIEFHNKTNYVVNADLQIEFYDENNTPVDVKDVYISGCAKNGVYYDGIYTDAKYASYKIKGKQELSVYTETYIPKVEIVSSNVSNENYYIVQIKNNHTKELSSAAAIALFKDANGNIIAFKEYTFNSIAPGDTAMDKRSLPYGDDYKPITYDKVDVIVFEAREKIDF